jgi:hypothetical protein
VARNGKSGLKLIAVLTREKLTNSRKREPREYLQAYGKRRTPRKEAPLRFRRLSLDVLNIRADGVFQKLPDFIEAMPVHSDVEIEAKTFPLATATMDKAEER